ncbi:DUF58 domain-containing protein [Halogranum rubrum]|uniref:DUF58 domain-containing protein n=1 Tax=Halogranum salarium B-1 TaxID=1210908 RepID=J3EXT5_9EURY|nr:DUF58 domain-containing protein [Halogranum salarium]EJN60017.1 hypothetical protein HSB1_21750 [Halogranum salarium B-1]
MSWTDYGQMTRDPTTHVPKTAQAEDDDSPAASDGVESDVQPASDSPADVSSSADGSDGSDGSPRQPDSTSARVTTESSTATSPVRWDVGLTVGLLAGATGVLVGNPAVFLSAVVGLTYAGYRYATRPPTLDLTFERTLSDTSPSPGSTVEVTLTVTNEDENSVADLRVVDGVPEKVAVVDGSPRVCTSLRPGESDVVVYTVRAYRGSHVFDDTVVAARNVSGAAERRATVTVPTTLTCEAGLEHVSLTSQTIASSGRVSTNSGGHGLEFYATRKHQPSDPMSRVDWKRFARTGELTTVLFRQERAATVVVVVDTRPDAHVVREEGEPDAVWLSAYAGERLTEALLNASNRVGAALYGPEESYLTPGTGRDQALRVGQFFETIESPAEETDFFGSRTADWGFDALLKRLPSDAQVVFLSPFVDDDPTTAVRRLQAHGHAVTVVTPDLSGDTLGGTVSRMGRKRRLSELRRREIRVVEWSPDEPLYTAVDRAAVRWSP